MKAGQASRTAQHMALFRAMESTLPAKRRLFEDQLAGRKPCRPGCVLSPLYRIAVADVAN
jgi:hypothetical protein